MSIYITIQIGWSFDREHVLDLGVMLGMDVSISDYKHQLITPCQSGPGKRCAERNKLQGWSQHIQINRKQLSY